MCDGPGGLGRSTGGPCMWFPGFGSRDSPRWLGAQRPGPGSARGGARTAREGPGSGRGLGEGARGIDGAGGGQEGDRAAEPGQRAAEGCRGRGGASSSQWSVARCGGRTHLRAIPGRVAGGGRDLPRRLPRAEGRDGWPAGVLCAFALPGAGLRVEGGRANDVRCLRTSAGSAAVCFAGDSGRRRRFTRGGFLANGRRRAFRSDVCRAAEKSVDRAVARGRECDGELCVVGEPECRRLPGAVRSSAFWKTWTRRRLTGETPSLPGRGPAGAAARRRERSLGDPSTLQTTRQQARSRGPGWVAVLAGAAWPGPPQLLRPRPLRPGPRAAPVTNGQMTETSLATVTAAAHWPTLGGDRLCRPGPPRRRLPRSFPGGAGFARGPAAGQEGR